MEKYIVTRESYYYFAGFKVGDVVESTWKGDEYGGFVWNASKPRPEDHSEGCYYHLPGWCRESLVPYTPESPPDMAELIERHAEFESAGRWYYRGFIVAKDHYVQGKGIVPGWHVCGIDPFARGNATRPFKRMRDAFAWIESGYGDSHVA